MSQSSLPNPRQVLSSLLAQLQQGAVSGDTSSNPLKDAPDEIRKILLTIHVIYPNELLPALDLLDRRLLTRFTIKPWTTSAKEGPASDVQAHRQPSLYIVRSAQQSRTPTTARSYDPIATHYEVRPVAWNCSCPAFAFAAFPASNAIACHQPGAEAVGWSGGGMGQEVENEPMGFGGLSRGIGAPPVCKHLLACVLAEHCTMFKGFVEEAEVSDEEIAGWCAGWGD